MTSSLAPTSSPSSASPAGIMSPPSFSPLPPISQSATPSTEPPIAAPPQLPSAAAPLPSSASSASPPLIENPTSPLSFSSPPSPASSVIPPPAISIPAALPPAPSLPTQSSPSPALQTSPPSSPLTITSPPPSAPSEKPTRTSSPPPPPSPSEKPTGSSSPPPPPSAPSEKPTGNSSPPPPSAPSEKPTGSSSPPPPKHPSPPPHRKPTPPETPEKSPRSPVESPPPPDKQMAPESSPSSPIKGHSPTKSSPQPGSGPSDLSPPRGQVLPPPPSPSARSFPDQPPSEFSISPIGTPFGHVPLSTVPTNASDERALVGKQSRIKPGEAAGISVPIALIILLVVSVAWFMRKKKTKEATSSGYIMPSPIACSDMSEPNFPGSQSVPLVKASSGSNAFSYSPPNGGLAYSTSWFALEELSGITNGFSPHNILGQGGFGAVYKGCLPDGREVAVKQLKVGSGQGEREFQAEVEIISRIHHRHLVTLVGYCMSENQRLLVYDFLPNNTLFYHLHGAGRPVLDWGMRVKVATGAARGIAYLHEDCHPRIIHRDIKSSNILLDKSFEARVSDFGLAKLTMDAETHVTTRVMGTFGYLAPEYASSGKLTDRSDVFSFGVVLLELITGRKPVDASQPIGDESLVEWARPLMSQVLETGDLGELPDPRLERNYNETEMFQMIEAAAACVRHSASMRPRMGLVMRALDNLAGTVYLDNGVKPGKSEIFDSIADSEEIRDFQRMAFGSQEYRSDFTTASRFSQSRIDV